FGTDLTRANLANARLNSAQLVGAQLSGARLDSADLTDANLFGAQNAASIPVSGTMTFCRTRMADGSDRSSSCGAAASSPK
ncbi:MAG: hypothetical protein ACJAU5_001678, partial [Maricaulis maris]